MGTSYGIFIIKDGKIEILTECETFEDAQQEIYGQKEIYGAIYRYFISEIY